MSGHTKGPWRSEPDSYPGILNVVAVDGTRVAGPFILIATDLTTADYRRRTADADLIAAATEMLEVLKVYAEFDNCSNVDDRGTCTPERQCICCRARAAAAKAEGRQP